MLARCHGPKPLRQTWRLTDVRRPPNRDSCANGQASFRAENPAYVIVPRPLRSESRWPAPARRRPANASMCITWPACGDCSPSLRARCRCARDRAARLLPDASARFISTRPSRCTLQCFDLVAVLDGLEMLPGISHDQQEQAGQRNSKLSHLAAALRILHFHQARIVDGLGEINFRRAGPARLRADGSCREVTRVLPPFMPPRADWIRTARASCCATAYQ